MSVFRFSAKKKKVSRTKAFQGLCASSCTSRENCLKAQFWCGLLVEILTNFLSAVKMSIHVRPGDSVVPPILCKKSEGSTLALSIALIATRSSVGGTFLVLAAVLSTAKCCETSTLLFGVDRNSSASSSTVTDGSTEVASILAANLTPFLLISSSGRTQQKSRHNVCNGRSKKQQRVYKLNKAHITSRKLHLPLRS